MSQDKEREKSQEKSARKPKLDLDQGVKRLISVIVLAALFLISVLSLLSQAGLAGDYFRIGAQKLLGSVDFFLPLVFLLMIYLHFKKDKRTRILMGAGMFLVSFLGILKFVGIDSGYLGLLVNYPLEKFGSFYVELVILSSLLISSLLILINAPIFSFKKSPKENTAEPEIRSQSIDEEKRFKKILPQPILLRRSKEPWSGKTNQEYEGFALDLLDNRVEESISSGNIENNKKIVQETLSNFGIDVEMKDALIGPTVTQYSFKPALGVKLSRITSLQNDLALALAAHPLRIEAPIPGKSLVGLEVPNQKASIVRLAPLLKELGVKKRFGGLTLALGRDVAGSAVFADLDTMPHLLVAGATGAGKTVALNAILLSLIYKHPPQDLNLILIDPKRVELVHYNGIPHLLSPVVVEHKQATETLTWALGEMEDRFKKLQQAGVRDIDSFNSRKLDKMSYLVIVIDELADLMSLASREVETVIVRLAQMSRAVGIHLIISTQRPSVNVITGLIKANISSRIAFQVTSQVDSRTILDMAGAEKLLGNGDMLFLPRDLSRPRRIQGAFVSEREVKSATHNLKRQEEPRVKLVKKDRQEIVLNESRFLKPEGKEATIEIDDDLYEDAKNLVVQAERASASLLQRHLRVGYSRAARLLDLLEARGVIGPHQGAKPRKVLIEKSYAPNS